MSSTNLSPEQLAARWDVKIETLQRWRCDGVGPRFLKIERHVRYRLEDIESYESVSLRSCVVAAQEVSA